MAFACARPASAADASPMADNPGDFPPGSFSDGGHYKLSDFQGKVLVLFFYEQDCPTCRGLIPERNKVVEKFKDRPVKFLAVGPNDNMIDVVSYVKGTHLEMPSFADTMGVMEYRYKFHISLKNIYQFRILGPNGNVVGMSFEPADIEAALKDVKWKYKDGGYDPGLKNIVELIEWNQYAPAVRQLKGQLKAKGALGESANKLMDAVKAEGKGWLEEAEKAKESDAIHAYDLYTKVSTVFTGDEMGKTADAALKTLKTNKTLADELAARTMYSQLDVAMTKAQPTQRGQLISYCQSIAKKYPSAPTGMKAEQLAKDLEGAAANATGK